MYVHVYGYTHYLHVHVHVYITLFIYSSLLCALNLFLTAAILLSVPPQKQVAVDVPVVSSLSVCCILDFSLQY